MLRVSLHALYFIAHRINLRYRETGDSVANCAAIAADTPHYRIQPREKFRPCVVIIRIDSRVTEAGDNKPPSDLRLGRQPDMLQTRTGIPVARTFESRAYARRNAARDSGT